MSQRNGPLTCESDGSKICSSTQRSRLRPEGVVVQTPIRSSYKASAELFFTLVGEHLHSRQVRENSLERILNPRRDFFRRLADAQPRNRRPGRHCTLDDFREVMPVHFAGLFHVNQLALGFIGLDGFLPQPLRGDSQLDGVRRAAHLRVLVVLVFDDAAEEIFRVIKSIHARREVAARLRNLVEVVLAVTSQLCGFRFVDCRHWLFRA